MTGWPGNKNLNVKKIFVPLLFWLLAAMAVHAGQSAWVFYNNNHTLVYSNDSLGNRVMDFSYAGYAGGGVAIPTNISVATNVSAIVGDNTAAIQGAINYVSGLPLNTSGFRGVVLLNPGIYTVAKSLTISASGVVLRGAGSGIGGTTIQVTSTSSITLFNIAGSSGPSQSGAVSITNSYVPSGAMSFNLSNASSFSVGNTVMINRTVTTNWINYMQMQPGAGVATNETWISPGNVIKTDRSIAQISGNQITLDAPLTDSFDSKYLGNPAGTIANYAWTGRISQVGLEHLNIQQPAVANGYGSVNMNNIIDSWLCDVAIQDGVNCVWLNNNTKRITVDTVTVSHTVPQTNSAGPSDFSCTGTQVLFNQCQSYGTRSWPFATGSTGTGPIVLLNFSFLKVHSGWRLSFPQKNRMRVL
jgi:hypothetical protein